MLKICASNCRLRPEWSRFFGCPSVCWQFDNSLISFLIRRNLFQMTEAKRSTPPMHWSANKSKSMSKIVCLTRHFVHIICPFAIESLVPLDIKDDQNGMNIENVEPRKKHEIEFQSTNTVVFLEDNEQMFVRYRRCFGSLLPHTLTLLRRISRFRIVTRSKTIWWRHCFEPPTRKHLAIGVNH